MFLWCSNTIGDLQYFNPVAGVRIENPFVTDFTQYVYYITVHIKNRLLAQQLLFRENQPRTLASRTYATTYKSFLNLSKED